VNDRRIWFFLAAAAICGALVPAAPSEFRWVPTALVVIYLVLAALVALEKLGRRRDGD
jgi:ABC-type transport system involved in cytochrome c biogenesis permease component